LEKKDSEILKQLNLAQVDFNQKGDIASRVKVQRLQAQKETNQHKLNKEHVNLDKTLQNSNNYINHVLSKDDKNIVETINNPDNPDNPDIKKSSIIDFDYL